MLSRAATSTDTAMAADRPAALTPTIALRLPVDFSDLHHHSSYRTHGRQLELGRAHTAKSGFLQEIAEAIASAGEARHGD